MLNEHLENGGLSLGSHLTQLSCHHRPTHIPTWVSWCRVSGLRERTMPTFLSGDWAVWKQTFSESKSLRTHNTSLYVINSVRRNEQENKFLRQKNSCVSQFFCLHPLPRCSTPWFSWGGIREKSGNCRQLRISRWLKWPWMSERGQVVSKGEINIVRRRAGREKRAQCFTGFTLS